MGMIQDISVNFGQRSRFVVFGHNIMMFFMGIEGFLQIIEKYHPSKYLLYLQKCAIFAENKLLWDNLSITPYTTPANNSAVCRTRGIEWQRRR